MSLLHPGDAFPELTLTVPGGKTVTVPEVFAGQFGVVLFFRGAWCPYCNAQLGAFQRASATLADAGARVVALSVDDEATTAGLIAKHGLTFPVGFGADARAVADLTGAFVNQDPVYLQSTGSWLTKAPVRPATARASAPNPTGKVRPCLAIRPAVAASSSTDRATIRTPASARVALARWKARSWALQ